MSWISGPTLVFALAAGLVAAWLVYRIRANHRLVRPPVLDAAGRPYEIVEFTLSDGSRVPLLDAGQGPAIVMIPGADGIHQTWRHQVPDLAKGHRVLSADLRSRVSGDADFDLLCRDVVELLDALGVERAVVVGQSLGGAIALRLAVRYPERVRGLVVANSLTRVSYRHVGLNRALLVPLAMATTRYLPTSLARAFARLWSRLVVWVYDDSPGSERVIDYVFHTGPRTVPPSVSGARVGLLKGEDLRPELRRIEAPALIVKGPRDTYVPVAWSREIAGLVPDAEYAEVPGTGHCSHISMPDTFNAILLEWLYGGARTPDSREAEA
ncbi:MAG: alpha/beta fold hydrolase [Gemmatimonadota bacterium]